MPFFASNDKKYFLKGITDSVKQIVSNPGNINHDIPCHLLFHFPVNIHRFQIRRKPGDRLQLIFGQPFGRFMFFQNQLS